MLRVPVSIWLSFVSEPHEEHHDSQSSKEGPLASVTKLRHISNEPPDPVRRESLRMCRHPHKARPPPHPTKTQLGGEPHLLSLSSRQFKALGGALVQQGAELEGWRFVARKACRRNFALLRTRHCFFHDSVPFCWEVPKRRYTNRATLTQSTNELDAPENRDGVRSRGTRR
jgi:hypothetical protein